MVRVARHVYYLCQTIITCSYMWCIPVLCGVCVMAALPYLAIILFLAVYVIGLSLYQDHPCINHSVTICDRICKNRPLCYNAICSVWV